MVKCGFHRSSQQSPRASHSPLRSSPKYASRRLHVSRIEILALIREEQDKLLAQAQHAIDTAFHQRIREEIAKGIQAATPSLIEKCVAAAVREVKNYLKKHVSATALSKKKVREEVRKVSKDIIATTVEVTNRISIEEEVRGAVMTTGKGLIREQVGKALMAVGRGMTQEGRGMTVRAGKEGDPGQSEESSGEEGTSSGSEEDEEDTTEAVGEKQEGRKEREVSTESEEDGRDSMGEECHSEETSSDSSMD